ncbi:hypothetical protein F503_01534 [Ophiostoma piceae UAMH 11346]|uniref:Rab-GAP TBC domain-containing protein n=1 Tax=Ophiostoma piceae (strain UAMH 11346) TaxID=1262450 RepID=S3CAG1_OPHP1|nr:hypothetical protein F503_01534 [Ophiostoma piceae UAMH 11346]
MTSVSMPASPYTACSDGSPLPSPTSSCPLSPSSLSPSSLSSSPTSPTSPRYPLAIPRPSGLAAPPVEQHPALRGAASPAFRPIVEENGEAAESTVVPSTSAAPVVRSPSTGRSSATAQRAADRATKRATIAVLPSALPVVPAARAPQAKRDSVLGSPSNSMVSLNGEKKSDAAPRSPNTSPTFRRSTSYKRPSVSHMKQMIPLKTVEMNLPASSGPPPQRPPPPVPTRMSSKQSTGTSKKRPASQIAAAPQLTPVPAVSEVASQVAKPMGIPSIIPMPALAPAPALAPVPAAREKSWRLPKALSFRSGAFQRKKTAPSDGTGAPSALGVTARPGSFLPPVTANGLKSPLPCTVEPNQPTKPNASWPPILASPLSHAHAHSHPQHAPSPKTSTTTSSTPSTPSASSRPFSSSSFASSIASASTAVPACTSTTSRPSSRRSIRPASRLSTHFSSLTLSPSRPTSSTCNTPLTLTPSAAQQKQQQDFSPPSSSHFFFRVLSMSDSRQKKQATEDGKGSKHNDNNSQTLSPLINTAIPTESLIEDDLFESLTFSKRGSLMFGGKRAVDVASAMTAYDAQAAPPQRPRNHLSSGLWHRPSSASRSRTSSSPITSNPTNPTNLAAPTTQPPPDAQTSDAPNAPDIPSLSIAATDLLHPDPAAASNHAAGATDPARLSIVSTTSIATASTGIALSGTESSLSLVIPQPTSNPSSPHQPTTPSAAGTSAASTPSKKDTFELAGGIEDWEDVDVADVDRYGFIRAKPRPLTSVSSMSSLATAAGEDDAPDAISARAGIGRHFSRRYRSTPSRKNTARSMYTSRTTSTTATAAAAARSSLRAAANQLPHNKDRKWIDEAGDMLTMEPGLGDIAEDEDAERLAELVKRKEWERAEKWRRMAKVVVRGQPSEGTATDAADASATAAPPAPVSDGGGMDFEFDLQHPKLIERTWKGIPDRWRAPAWYSFLASSAQHRRAQRVPPVPPLPSSVKDKAPATQDSAKTQQPKPDGGESEEQIIAAFYRLQETASPDDVQIDLDVPRTVNGHVMFRKRYRGGQRLLFRVLHSLSLYFADTGYVQGMAALGATLLCYYDEERCFVMLVRLFHLRGLERLYEPGFGGLMEALGEFEQKWLARNNPRIAQKLTLLNIDATTYATRWYLTLFNLSVPFPAQLRIWDVFMLLGDGEMEVGPLQHHASSSASSILKRPSTARPASARPATARPATADPKAKAKATEHLSATALITASAPKPLASKANLDVLHATSTALIDGLQEVLQDADFENAMKAVTSWVPIKDENLLMKVVHAEWKRHQRMKK